MKPLLSCWLGIRRKHLERRVCQTWQVCNYTTHMRKLKRTIAINHRQQQILLSILAPRVCAHILPTGEALWPDSTKSDNKRRKQSAWLSAENTSVSAWKAFRRAAQPALSTTPTMWERLQDKLSACDHKYLVLFLSTALKAWEAGDGARVITSVLQIPHSVSAGREAGRSLSVGKNIPFFPPLARCTFAAIADIGNEPKWIRSALTASPFLLHTPRPVSFLPYWAMIGWSHWPQPIINHCRLQVPQVFFFFFPPLLLISLSRATAMMDITVGMFFISSGAGNGLGPPPHSGIKTKEKIKNALGAKLQRERTWATDRLGAVRVVIHQGTATSVRKDVFPACEWETLFCCKVCSIWVFYCSKYSEKLRWRGAFIRFSQERGLFCPTACSTCTSSALLWTINSLDSRWSCLYS